MEPRNYCAYLLRLWRENSQAPWRVMLEDPHTGERRGFAGVGGLVAFLIQKLQEVEDNPAAMALGPGEEVYPSQATVTLPDIPVC